MPYRTFWEPKGIYWQHYGMVTAEEIFEANNTFYSDRRSDNAHYQIIDCLNVEHIELDETAMLKMAAFDKAHSETTHQLKLAFIGVAQPLLSVFDDYIRHSQKLDSPWKMKTFETLQAARNWLG